MRVEHELGGVWVEPLDLERRLAKQHLVVEIDPQVELDVRDAELLDVRKGMVIEPALQRREVGACGRERTRRLGRPVNIGRRRRRNAGDDPAREGEHQARGCPAPGVPHASARARRLRRGGL